MDNPNLTTADIEAIEAFAASQTPPYRVGLNREREGGIYATLIHREQFTKAPIFVIIRASSAVLVVGTLRSATERKREETFWSIDAVLSAIRKELLLADFLAVGSDDLVSPPSRLN